MPGFLADSAGPAIAVMIGEAENRAISAAMSVRSGDSRIPISRRSPAARISTVSTVKNANRGMLKAVTVERYRARRGPAALASDRALTAHWYLDR
jgi:hypothetical protein